MPIYGRGGAQEDPRGKQRIVLKESLQDSSVPRRPAGQRLVPADVRQWPWLHGAMGLLLIPALTARLTVQRGTAAQHTGNANMQPGLGIIPMLLGLNNSSGIHNSCEALFAQQQQKV